jgi:hypothetical protein
MSLSKFTWKADVPQDLIAEYMVRVAVEDIMGLFYAKGVVDALLANRAIVIVINPHVTDDKVEIDVEYTGVNDE